MRERAYNFILMGTFVAVMWYVTSFYIDESLLNDPAVNIGRVVLGMIVALVFKFISERSFRKDIMKTIKRGILK